MCKEENLQITRFLTVGDREGLRVFVSPKDRLPPVYRKKGELIISVDDFIELSLKLGPISPEGFDALAAAADRYGACCAAVHMLSVGACSQKKLAEKLRAKGFSSETADMAVSFAATRGYIDERAQIESYLRLYIENRNYGPRKILPALLSRGYAKSDISDCLLAYTEADFAQAKARFLLQKFKKRRRIPPMRRKKCAPLCTNRGFKSEIILLLARRPWRFANPEPKLFLSKC